jgi:hypothetical protein
LAFFPAAFSPVAGCRYAHVVFQYYSSKNTISSAPLLQFGFKSCWKRIFNLRTVQWTLNLLLILISTLSGPLGQWPVCSSVRLIIHLATCMFHVFLNCNKIWPFLKNTAENGYFEFAFNFWNTLKYFERIH